LFSRLIISYIIDDEVFYPAARTPSLTLIDLTDEKLLLLSSRGIYEESSLRMPFLEAIERPPNVFKNSSFYSLKFTLLL
jgi:hypothetical protein